LYRAPFVRTGGKSTGTVVFSMPHSFLLGRAGSSFLLTGWVRIQSAAETMLIYRVIREKKQRFEVIRGVYGIDQ
jgi:hypothetical protein